MEYDPKNLNQVCHLTIDNIKQSKIAKSPIHGFGLFATEDIESGKQLCLLEGQLLSKKEYRKISAFCEPFVSTLSRYLFMECNYVSLDLILVRPFRTKYSYINHSKTPNLAVLHNPIRIETLMHINANEEMTIDYTKECLSIEYLNRTDKAFLAK